MPVAEITCSEFITIYMYWVYQAFFLTFITLIYSYMYKETAKTQSNHIVSTGHRTTIRYHRFRDGEAKLNKETVTVVGT